MDGFSILSAQGITRTLAGIERHWDAGADELEAFRSWAWVVASVCETYASENLGACAELLHDERQALHRVLAERLHLKGDVSPELVSKRAFLEYLEHQLLGDAPLSAAA
jgi:hypothetical protein